jgi:dTDP-4-amino-4,6-dideoxygalactose transaminase
MGLCNLAYITEIFQRRKDQCNIYDDILKNLEVARQHIQDGCEFNYAYYPIIFETETLVLKAQNALVKKEIFPRRYFYPSLSTLHYVKGQPTPISDSIASRILCLPLYHELSAEEQNMIARILLRTQNY